MREFRYNGPRARYLAMDYDTYGSDDPADWTPTYPATWTISDGVLPYVDREIAGPTATPTDVMRYLGTAAQQPLAGNGVPTDTLFLHADLIGSTNLTTDGAGNPASTLAYTAFGETIGDPSALGTRYQYVGRHGYESDLLALDGVNPSLPPITLQHVGARWYQPDTGRFVQRDPIGLAGGLSVYAYCINSPLALIDPSGLAVDEDILVAGSVYFGWQAGAAAAAPNVWALGPVGTVIAGGAVAGAGAGHLLVKHTPIENALGWCIFKLWYEEDEPSPPKPKQGPTWKPKKPAGGPPWIYPPFAP
jgi:uncharacterized protein RhaS with RHS repeats